MHVRVFTRTKISDVQKHVPPKADSTTRTFHSLSL